MAGVKKRDTSRPAAGAAEDVGEEAAPAVDALTAAVTREALRRRLDASMDAGSPAGVHPLPTDGQPLPPSSDGQPLPVVVGEARALADRRRAGLRWTKDEAAAIFRDDGGYVVGGRRLSEAEWQSLLSDPAFYVRLFDDQVPSGAG